MILDCGRSLPDCRLAYETWGDPSNPAVLIGHFLMGDQHCAGQSGWWNRAIGPGLGIDTDRFFVICPNLLGGCAGSTGPSSLDPETGQPYGSKFPELTLRDMVRAQKELLDQLGIERLHAVIGPCTGGLLALIWGRDYPERVGRVVAVAVSPRTTAQSIAMHEAARQAIVRDPGFLGGDYYGHEGPRQGMVLASMFGLLFMMRAESLEEKFGRRPGTVRPFLVEDFLNEAGEASALRFDANSLIVLTRAMDRLDLTEDGLTVRCPVLLVSYASDWRFPPSQAREIEQALGCEHVILDSAFGHQGFRYDTEELNRHLRSFL